MTMFDIAREYYGKIYLDKSLESEAFNYSNGTKYYVNMSDKLNDTLGCGLTYNDYKTYKESMLESIYKNGGFWIGRYEAGIENARTSINDSIDNLKPQSKIDLYPLNNVKCNQAQTIANRLDNIGNYNCSLMFGIQWDLVIRHLNNKGVAKQLLTQDSSSWGNYNVNYDLNQTTAHGYKGVLSHNDWITLTWSAIGNGYSKNVSVEPDVVFSTGITERNKLKNIYDLAGNVFEWTLENTHDPRNGSGPCRGGFYADGSWCPASRRDSMGTTYGGSGVRF